MQKDEQSLVGALIDQKQMQVYSLQEQLRKANERIAGLEGLLNKSENLFLYLDSYLKEISVRRNDIDKLLMEYLAKRGKNG